MKQAAKYAVGLAAIAVLAAPAPQTARSASFQCGSGFMQTTRVVTLGTQTTSSQMPVDLTGATFSFTPGDRCLVVEVSGQVRAVGPNALRLNVVVTGAVVDPPFPPFRDVYTQTTSDDGRIATFWVNLDEGDKDVKVQFLSVNGQPVSLTKGIVVFKHTPGT